MPAVSVSADPTGAEFALSSANTDDVSTVGSSTAEASGSSPAKASTLVGLLALGCLPDGSAPSLRGLGASLRGLGAPE